MRKNLKGQSPLFFHQCQERSAVLGTYASINSFKAGHSIRRSRTSRGPSGPRSQSWSSGPLWSSQLPITICLSSEELERKQTGISQLNHPPQIDCQERRRKTERRTNHLRHGSNHVIVSCGLWDEARIGHPRESFDAIEIDSRWHSGNRFPGCRNDCNGC